MRKGAQILDRFQKNFRFCVFPLVLSNFWVGAWFPFDEEQFSDEHMLVELPDGTEEVVDLFDYIPDHDPKFQSLIYMWERIELIESLPAMQPQPPQDPNNNENPLLIFQDKKYQFNFEKNTKTERK